MKICEDLKEEEGDRLRVWEKAQGTVAGGVRSSLDLLCFGEGQLGQRAA